MANNTRTARESEDSDLVREESLRILAQAIALPHRGTRMEQLLADFDKGNGFANGWRMAVGECFRDSLDIKLSKKADDATEEATGEVTDEVVGDDSVIKWTQGGAFSFSLGDTIYDTPRAYQCWDMALKHIGMAYQVLAAAPSRPRKEITCLKKNNSFTGSLKGDQPMAQLARREQVFGAVSTDWKEKNEIITTVKEATGKGVSDELLETLCHLGALDRRVNVVELRFPGVVRFRVLTPNAERSNLCIKEEKVVSQDDFISLLIAGKTLSL